MRESKITTIFKGEFVMVDMVDETYSQQMQNELEPIGDPLSSKIKLHDKTGVPASGSIVVDGVITNIGGVALDWTFHTTDDDCEFEDE